MSRWLEAPIGGVLLDITGVLFESGPGGGVAIDGSVMAVKRLKESGLPVRFCTNETTITRKTLMEKLGRMGFVVEEKEIFSPIPAVCKILQSRGLRPYLVVSEAARPDFEGVDVSNPNCVVMGDAESNFSYDNLNSAFQILVNSPQPIFFSLGKGKYYKHGEKLVLDVGAFMKAIEYASDTQAEIVGKPSPAFFQTALQDMGITAQQCVMIGDDIVGDVGGAQAAGMRGVQVRTGKYRPQDENHPVVMADGFADNLSQAVNQILAKLP